MKKILLCALASAAMLGACSRSAETSEDIAFDTPLDSILLSDPAVLADSATQMYYMTGTGGKLWKSRDLEMWAGPYDVLEVDTTSWMGSRPEVWAAELHRYGDRYYYFATITNNSIIVDTINGIAVPRRASHVFVSDRPDGPYRPAGTADYLPATTPTLDGTLWVEADGRPYMVYCGEWLANDNGTMEAIPLTADLTAPAGEPDTLFRASDNPWSRERIGDRELGFNRVTDGPWLFRTETGRLGMIWTSWIYNVYTMGVAYSESGTLAGPWIQSEQPLTAPDHGHGMIFRTLDGRTLLSLHSHKDDNGRYVRRPVFLEVDLSGDSLRLK